VARVRVDIISIGTLSRNRLWNETGPVRTAHATTTLIRSGERNILVDPGLPPPVIAARLAERTALRPEQIDTVFLTNFRPAHRAGLAAFPRARIFLHEHEQQAVQAHLEQLRDRVDPADRTIIQKELDLLESVQNPSDQPVQHVDLFPLFGYTPGTCGLLVSLTTSTLLITGDAVPTADHFLAGQVLPDAWDVTAAQESLAEVYEIADLIIPGHDNLFLNPRIHGL
jgi:glyoxylase-like metal-dependent hydrolase (beta-lactamase superfamily II)